MRISLKVGGVYYRLAGQSGVSEQTHSSSGDFRISAESKTQLLQRLRAVTAGVADRGNLTTTITFSTSRLFATAAEAFLFVLDYDAAFPLREGILVMDALSPSGVPSRRNLLDVVVTPPERSVIGCTALFTYQATGAGIITATSPAFATGTITVTGSITAYNITIAGVTLSATGLASTAPTAAAALIASEINLLTALPVTAASAAGVITLTAKDYGTGGNAITYSEASTNITASGSTLTGGTNG